MATIALKDVRKAYGKVTVIPAIDLEIASGEFVVLVGPSGCGKSTLLRMIAGLEEITAGSIAVGGKVINALAPSERNVAMVFQDYALYPHMSVAENMAFGLKMRGENAAEIDRRVTAAAAILKLEALLDRRPSQLSGGQRQRVAMGRAIVRQPEAFLFDEPLSNLDAALRVEMRLEIAKLHRRMAATTVYVTHDQVEAMTLADRIVVMNAGKVEQLGPPMALYHRPESLFVARFIGSPTMNTLDVPAGASGGDLAVTLPGGARAVAAGAARTGVPAAVTLGVRPEDLVACDPADAWFSGQLAVVERLGSQTFGYLDIGGDRLITIELPRTSEAAVGDAFAVSAAPEALHLFDAATGLRLN